MFESAELGHKIDKATYDREVPLLREALLRAQYDLIQQAKFPVVILVGGVDGAGKSETVNLLNEWMDPRYIQTHGMGPPNLEEKQRPYMWRFWRVLPPKGRIGILFGSWYSQPILDRVLNGSKGVVLDQHMEQIARFEKMLADEGALILKFWMHLSKGQQLKRLKALEKDPATRWRVTEEDWRRFKVYDKFRKTSERALRRTSTAEAPWQVVEGNDHRYRSLTVGKSLLRALEAALKDGMVRRGHAPPLVPAIDQLHLLKTLDLSLALPKKSYERQLEKYQGRLNILTREPGFQNISVMTVFEGNDAAGKGGAIRRVTGALDARRYQIIPIAAPTEEERAQPYLWRFWRHVPAHGRFVIFDRSWYGRVLVERVEGFCSEYDWMRAYAEIVDFEDQLAHNRAVIVKFWLSISKEEQLKRFQEREKIAFKQFKLTEEDWRNREKWEPYEMAVCDMVERTSTRHAPWTLVEANDKYYARIKVLKTLCDSIEQALG
jgi:polyphosphate:AMP phosphotransferase